MVAIGNYKIKVSDLIHALTQKDAIFEPSSNHQCVFRGGRTRLNFAN